LEGHAELLGDGVGQVDGPTDQFALLVFVLVGLVFGVDRNSEAVADALRKKVHGGGVRLDNDLLFQTRGLGPRAPGQQKRRDRKGGQYSVLDTHCFPRKLTLWIYQDPRAADTPKRLL